MVAHPTSASPSPGWAPRLVALALALSLAGLGPALAQVALLLLRHAGPRPAPPRLRPCRLAPCAAPGNRRAAAECNKVAGGAEINNGGPARRSPGASW